jgi:hypothetical protein
MSYLKIEGHPGLLKDSVSGAILNNDKQAIEDYKSKKMAMQRAREAKNEVAELGERVDKLQNDISEIKRMLEGLVK